MNAFETFLKAKDSLERNLEDIITHKLQIFKSNFGLMPKKIIINMIEVTRMSDEKEEYELGEIDINFGL